MNADRDGRSVEELLQDVVDKFRSKDEAAQVKIHTTGVDNELSVLFFSSSHMMDQYRRFPEVLFFDGTYRTNVHLYALYVFLIKDGHGYGQPVGFGFLRNETAECVTLLIQDFLDVMGSCSGTRVVFIDKDFTEAEALSAALPHASILLCYFHVVKYLNRVIADLVIDKDQKKTLMKLFKATMYSQAEVRSLQCLPSFSLITCYFIAITKAITLLAGRLFEGSECSVRSGQRSIGGVRSLSSEQLVFVL